MNQIKTLIVASQPATIARSPDWWKRPDILNGVPFLTFDEAMTCLEEYAMTMEGQNFALLMQQGDVYKVYPRPHQPCQGGEMRTYGASHPNDCTRPDDRRPGDLRMAFPDGTPLAVAKHLHIAPKPFSVDVTPLPNVKPFEEMREIHNDFIETIYGPDSMYIPSLGGPESIVLIKNGNGCYEGIIYTDTNVDSTVLVNSLQFLNSKNSLLLRQLLNIGFTKKEALAVMMLNGGYHNPSDNKISLAMCSTYYFSNKASLRRIFESKPNDLTGGTFKNRFAYNRPFVQDLFKATEDEIEVNFFEAFKEVYRQKYNEDAIVMSGYQYIPKFTNEQFVEITRMIFQQCYFDNGGLKETLEIKKEKAA